MEDPRVEHFIRKGLTEDQAMRKLGLTGNVEVVTPVETKELKTEEVTEAKPKKKRAKKD